jgi:hypothetical protein
LSYILPYLGHTWGPCLFLFIKVKEVLSLQYADASKADTTLEWYVCCVITMESKGKRKKDPFHSDVCRAASLLLPPWSPLHHTSDKKKIVLDGLVCCCETFSSTTSHYSYSPLFVFTSKEAMLLMKAEMADKNNSNRISTLWPTL